VIRISSAKAVGAFLVPLVLAATPSRAVILSPVSATASSEFSSNFGIGFTIDRSGLSSGFTSGVDDFDAYLAGNPVHTYLAPNFEWFSSGGANAIVDYDLGALYSVDKFALWNENDSGIGQFDLFASADGVTYTSLLTGISPIDNPADVDYPAEVFSLNSPTNLRYVRFDISGCPQPNPASFAGCGIGEVAFNVNSVNDPVGDQSVPGPLPLLGAMAAFGQARRIRRRLRGALG
jgi:hypothetical protein